MKSHWEQIKLADLFELQMGKTPAREKDQYWKNGDNKWVSIADIGKFLRYTDETKEKITDIAISESGIKQVPKNTLIMSFKLSLGKVAITSETIYTNEAIMAFIDRKKRPLSLSFLFHLFKNKDWSAGTNKAVLGMTLNKATLKEISIPVPPLPEQEDIAQKLDTVCRLITLREQQLQKLDQLASSRFIEMFGDPVTNPKRWEKISLSNICNIGSSKRIFEREYVSHGIPFYRTKELVERAAGKKIATELFISIERFNEIKAKYGTPQKNDLLISAVGTIGIIWIVDETQFYFKDGNILRIEASENFNSIFLKFVLEQLIREYKKQMSAGTAYAALTIVNLKKMEIFDIPLELQNKFAAFIEQLDKSKLADQTYGVAA